MVLLLVPKKWKMLTKPRQKLLVSSEARQFGSRQFGGPGVDIGNKRSIDSLSTAHFIK